MRINFRPHYLFRWFSTSTKRSIHRCPKCGAEVAEPIKTWQLVAPIPDSEGRITITIMGMFQCPNCGYKWRGVVSKLKVGRDVEIESGGVKKRLSPTREEEVKREAKVIELSVDEISEE